MKYFTNSSLEFYLLFGLLVAMPLPCSAEPAAFKPAEVKALADKLHIEIQTDNSQFPVLAEGEARADRPSQLALNQYLPLFLSEFSRYPPAVINKTGLKRVVFCQNLSLAGQRRLGVCICPRNELYLDVSDAAQSPEYLRTTVHHEFFHLIDQKEDEKNLEWETLNTRDFRYKGGSGKYQADPNSGVRDDLLAGFLNRYSMHSAKEDKAEMFAYMMIDYQWVSERSASDPVIRVKMKQLEKQLHEFSPSFDNEFWINLDQHQRITLKEELAPKSGEVVQTLDRLGRLYEQQGRYAEAVSLCRRSLEIREKELGFYHPEVARTKLTLAQLFFKQNKYVEAEPLYVSALRVAEKLWPPDSQDLVIFLDNYAQLLRATKRTEQAMKLDMRAKAIRAGKRTLEISRAPTAHSSTRQKMPPAMVALSEG